MDEDDDLLSLREQNRVLDKENKRLKKKLDRLNKKSTQQSEKIKQLQEEIRRLKEVNRQLRSSLYGLKPSIKKQNRSPDDSSKSEPTKRGPPIGHKGTSRKRPERVDKTVILQLDSCPYCNTQLSELEKTRERYVEDIVPLTLFVTKYVIKQGYCRKCGKVVYPDVPEVIENCHFGLHFLLYIVYLRYVMNLPENKITTLLNDTYNANVSEGTIVNYLQRAAEIFGDEYERIMNQMKEFNCYYDDTGQRVNGENKWLWVFISNEVALYYTSKFRSKKVVVQILGEDYTGVTVQDFYPSYDGAPGLKQKCWSHFIRDAKDLASLKKPPPQAKKFYKGLQRIYKDAKAAVDTQSTQAERESIHAAFVKRLERFAQKNWDHYALVRLAKRALKYSSELFTFMLIPGIEPTNNRAERALRPCVLQRKIWGCHRTDEGAKNRDILMSVIGSMNLQNKNILNYGQNIS